MADAGDGLRAFGIPFDEAVARRRAAESRADSCIGKCGTDEVDHLPRLAHINGKACFMLAAAGQRHIFLCEFKAVVPHGIRIQRLLLGVAAPAADGHDAPRRADAVQQRCQHDRRLPRQQHAGRVRHGGDQRFGRGPCLQGMCRVHQRQRARQRLLPGHCLHHTSATACSSSRSTSGPNSTPAPRIMPGKRLCSVKPGMVFTSLNTMRPSGV